jgi:hypothetical protein
MADRAPLIYNPSAGQLQELSLSDEISVGIMTATVYSTIKVVNTAVNLSNANHNYMMVGPVTVGAAGTILVGVGCSYVIV